MKKIIYIFIILLCTFYILSKNYTFFHKGKEINDNILNSKMILKLMHDDTKDLTYQETETIFEEKKIENIKFNFNKDTEYHFFDKNKDFNNLKVILEYIQNDFNIEINSRWKYQVNFISSNYGLVKFVYYINKEIGTNKSIIFEINDGVVDKVYYLYINNYVNEKEIIEKVEKFKKSTIQEKKELQDTEKLIEEKITYNYNYRIDKVIYSYCLFFQNEHGSIDNSYGSSYFVE